MKKILILILVLLSYTSIAQAIDHKKKVSTQTDLKKLSRQVSLFKRVKPEYICMVTDGVFKKPQIPVEVDGEIYYGCCQGCKSKLKKDASVREAIDPISGKTIHKSTAVIGVSPNNVVYYFESEENMRKFGAKK